MAGAGNITRTLLSGLEVAASGSVTINNNDSSFNNNLSLDPTAILSGGADINLNFDLSGQTGLLRKYLRVSSANNPYSGDWNVTSVDITPLSKLGGLYANAINALGSGHVTLSSSLLVNAVDGGLNSINGVSVGVNSLVQVDANWNNPTATLSLDDSSARVDINNAGTSVSIGNLTGVTGSLISSNGAGQALSINTTAASLYAGTITGLVSLTKSGAGTLTLTGTNSYTGGTTIAAGALQLGNGGTTGSIVGDVVNNGALVFNRSNLLAFGGAI
ncbi:hypothetical protein BTE77_35325, partial [Ensifer adhaerens]